ncbi:MAG TPA: hypothetical protein PKM72_02755 [Nitrospirales bacterium]|nr:hypothetical protein [Nitrospirales bacterium]
MPEDVAKNLIGEALKTEGADVNMRHEYAEKFTHVIPVINVARYSSNGEQKPDCDSRANLRRIFT